MIPLEDGSASGPFALIQGLPVHPLVVHAAVVFVPLAAIGLILMALIPKVGQKLGWLVTLTAGVALGAAFVAKESGEQLEKMVGEPGFDHAQWGDRMTIVAGVLFLACLLMWLVRARGSGGCLTIGAVVVSLVVAGASLFFIFKVGDTGARSVWEGEVSTDTSATAEPSATPEPSASPTATATGAATFTAAQVAKHNTATDCWTSINGTVYQRHVVDRPTPGWCPADPQPVRHRRDQRVRRPAPGPAEAGADPGRLRGRHPGLTPRADR